MDQLRVCAFCRNTGTRGAQWILYIGTNSHRVHKPCGEKLKETAPKEARVSLIPGKELAQQFRAANFWKNNFRRKPAAREEAAIKPSAEAPASA